MSKVSIEGLDKAAVLAALYNAASPLGFGALRAKSGPMTIDEARSIISKGDDVTRDLGGHNRLYFDYVYGRPLKIDLTGDIVDTRLYDRDQGQGTGQRVIIEIGGKLVDDTEPRPTAISINGTKHDICATEISYEHLVQLDSMEGTPSMTWKIVDSNDGGILHPGESVPVREGLVVNIVHTGNA